MSKALSEEELEAIRRQNVRNKVMIDQYDNEVMLEQYDVDLEADILLSPLTIASIGVRYVSELLGEVERLEQECRAWKKLAEARRSLHPRWIDQALWELDELAGRQKA